MEPYYFFFSYARKDLRQGYLSKFFEDLRDEVDGLIKEGEPSFRDVDRITPGDDWKTELKEALQTSRTLVCIYSTKYFTREWCGKEFQIFLDRQPQVRIEDGVAVDSHKIIPVLWQGDDILKGNDLPPRIAERILFFKGPENGLGNYIRSIGRRGIYWNAVEKLAAEIVKRAKIEPLPPLNNLPSFEITRNAFLDRIPEETTTIEGPETLVVIYPWVGADVASLYETWKPYIGARTIKSMLGELTEDLGYTLVTKLLDVTAAETNDQFIAILAEANQKNSLALFVLNPILISNPAFMASLSMLLNKVDWHGGFLIPSSSEDPSATESLVTKIEQMLETHLEPTRQSPRN